MPEMVEEEIAQMEQDYEDGLVSYDEYEANLYNFHSEMEN